MPRGGPKADTAANAPPHKLNLHALGGRVVSIFGPSKGRVMIEVPRSVAEQWFVADLRRAARSDVVDAVERELADLRKRMPDFANSSFAAALVVLAHEIEDPHHSAAATARCVKELRDTWEQLWGLTQQASKPAGAKDKPDGTGSETKKAPADGLGDLAKRREQRLRDRSR